MIFMGIVTFKSYFYCEKEVMCMFGGVSFAGMLFNTIIFFSMERDHESIFKFVSILF